MQERALTDAEIFLRATAIGVGNRRTGADTVTIHALAVLPAIALSGRRAAVALQLGCTAGTCRFFASIAAC